MSDQQSLTPRGAWLSRLLLSAAVRALAYRTQVFERIDAGRVAVAPVNANGVTANRFDSHHFQPGLVHLERVFPLGLARRRAVRAGATRAGALVAQVLESVFAVMAVLPIDFDALRFGDRDVFGVGGDSHSQLKRRSTSRTPEMRRMAATSFSSCFLSRTSTVISTIPPSWSNSVLASRLRMLVFSSDSTEVSWFSMPGRSSVWMTMRTGKASSAARAHSTSS